MMKNSNHSYKKPLTLKHHLKSSSCIILLVIFIFLCRENAFGANSNRPKRISFLPPQTHTSLVAPQDPSQTNQDSSTAQRSTEPNKNKTKVSADTIIIKLKNIDNEAQQKTKIRALLQNISTIDSISPVFKNIHTKRLTTGKSEQDLIEHVKTRFNKRTKRALKGRQSRDLGLSRIFTVKLKSKDSTPLINAINILKKSPDIEYVETNSIFTSQSGGTSHSNLPNDTHIDPDQNGTWAKESWGQSYEDLWGLKKISMETAWITTMGDSTIKIAVIDTGIDNDHPDLLEHGQVWINAAETPNDGIDNDKNGYVDDYWGWDFTTCSQFNTDGSCLASKSTSNNPYDGNGHGTHIAGIVGATGYNSRGICGMNSFVKVMAIKGLNDSQAQGSTIDLANSIIYAVDQGADIINLSWGGQTFFLPQTLRSALDYAYNLGAVIVTSAGNGTFGQNISTFYPANYQNSITVASTDYQDLRDPTSNYGAKIDVAAPGVDILSLASKNAIVGTVIAGCNVANGDCYSRLSGTSAAAAHVSGLAALILAIHPTFNSEQVKSAIKLGAEDVNSSLGYPGEDIYLGTGRINALSSFQFTDPLVAAISSPEDNDYLPASSVIAIQGTATGEGFQNYKLEYGIGDAPSSWTMLVSNNEKVINSGSTLMSWDVSGMAAGRYTLKLTATSIYNLTAVDTKIINLGAQAGWPQTIMGNVLSSPVSGDVDGDGKKEVIFTTESQVFVYHSDGTLLTNWPAIFSTGMTAQQPSLMDMDGDGKLDIIYVLWNSTTKKASLIASRYDGMDVPGFPFELPFTAYFDGFQYFSPVLSSAPPVLTDLDQDGKIEILLRTRETSNPVYVYTYNAQSNPKIQLKWTKLTGSINFNYLSPSIADINRDGNIDVIVPSSTQIYAFDKNGNNLSGWPTLTLGSTVRISTNAVIGDVLGDSQYEVAVIDSSHKKGYVYGSNGLQISITNWADPQSNYIVLTDMDGDGKNEIVGNREIIKIKTDNSAQYWSWTPSANFNLSMPITVDMTNDANHAPEVLFGNSWNFNDTISESVLYAYDKNGLPINNFNLANFPLQVDGDNGLNQNTLIADDFDNDGKLEILAISLPEVYVYSKIYMWKLGADDATSLKKTWTMSGHDAQHTNASISNDIHVPTNFSSIQNAINAAVNNNIIHVTSGTYNESLDFKGKKITILADNGPAVTTIKAPAGMYAANFHTNETRASVLQGFTLTTTSKDAVYINNSSPTITLNTIDSQKTSPQYIGVNILNGKPAITSNTILNWDKGVYVSNLARYRSDITSNTINSNNYGVYLSGSGADFLLKNLIYNNKLDGIRVEGPSRVSSFFPQIVHNTISDNIDDGIEITAPANPTLVGNIITFNHNRGVFENGYFSVLPAHGYNDVYGNTNGGNSIPGTGTDEVSIDPKLSDHLHFNYSLTAGSPCIDKGWPYWTDPDGTRTDIGAIYYNQNLNQGGGDGKYNDFDQLLGKF